MKIKSLVQTVALSTVTSLIEEEGIPADTTQTGVFVDVPVKGLHYETVIQNEYTDDTRELKMSDCNMTNLDLEPIMVKIMDKEEGLGWTLEYTKTIEQEYKRYLELCLKYPDLPIVPSKPIDEFWHFHILDTMKYHEDCDNIFGYFLHHFPYFGMRGQEDENNLEEAWQLTLALYQDTFNEKIDKNIWLNNVRCPNCGRRTKNSKFTMDKRPRLKDVA